MKFPIEIPSGREFDVVGFGTNAVDFLIRVPQYPSFDSKVELIDYIQAAGGEIATSMVGLQRLGARTAYIGRFGNDPAGTFGLNSLRDEGVDVSFAEIIDGAATQIAFIVIDAGSGERTVIWKRDKRLAYSPEEVPCDLAERSRVLHLTPHDTAAAAELAHAARRSGTIVSIDLDNKFDGLDEVLENTDIIIASADIPQKMFPDARSDSEALKKMQERYGASLVGITLGDTGSLAICGGAEIRTPGFPAPGGCKDTTGAGDSFRAGLIYGLINGEAVEESLRIANGVAALKCRAVGARTSLPTTPELSSLLKNPDIEKPAF